VSPAPTAHGSVGSVAPRRLVVATGNVHKLDEIRAILSERHEVDVELVSMRDLGVPEPVEDGATFEANALIKARACVDATGLAALADDSGLEVDALGGAPGVNSARYAGEPSDDGANNAKLIAALAEVPSERRTARFVCVAALVTPEGLEQVRFGTMTGRIVDEPRGDHGFGYDPYFVSDAAGDGRTNGQLSSAEKQAISHRGAAFRALRPVLQQVFGGR
jgi:XTP/dITP diphosphohydrolase